MTFARDAFPSRATKNRQERLLKNTGPDIACYGLRETTLLSAWFLKSQTGTCAPGAQSLCETSHSGLSCLVCRHPKYPISQENPSIWHIFGLGSQARIFEMASCVNFSVMSRNV